MFKFLKDALGASTPTPTPTREDSLAEEIRRLEAAYLSFMTKLKVAIETRNEEDTKRHGHSAIRTMRLLSARREELEAVKAKRTQRDADTLAEIDRLARVHGLNKVVSPAEAAARYEQVAELTA